MTRYVIGPDVAIRLAHDQAAIRHDHQLLAPTLLRSQMLSLLYQAARRGELTRRDAVWGARAGRAGRCAALRAAAAGGAPGGHRGDADPAAEKYGVTHRSSRLLARHLRIGDTTVARAWREYRVQPWRAQSFRFPPTPN